MKMKDVNFVKCTEYNPYHEKANSLGIRSFWRADYNGLSLAWADTKKECIEIVRRL